MIEKLLFLIENADKLDIEEMILLLMLIKRQPMSLRRRLSMVVARPKEEFRTLLRANSDVASERFSGCLRMKPPEEPLDTEE